MPAVKNKKRTCILFAAALGSVKNRVHESGRSPRALQFNKPVAGLREASRFELTASVALTIADE